MFRFFQKLRMKLAAENNFKKYSRYALGEIALVVIGILIALQINNWNDQRKNDIAIENLFTSFEKDLEKNIDEVSGLIDFGYYMDNIVQKWRERKVDREMILNNLDYSDIIFFTHTIRIIDDNLQEILLVEKQLPKKYEELIPLLKELETLLESQKKWEKIGIDIIVENEKYMSENFDWIYDKDSLSMEKRIEYCLTEPTYRNRVYRWSEIQLVENVWDATQLKTLSLILLWKIRELQGLNSKLTFKEFLEEEELVNFDEIACEESFETKERTSHFRSSYVFQNSLSIPVNLLFLNKKGELIRDVRLEAGEYLFNKFNLIAGLKMECVSENGCIRKYRCVDNGYCIIE